MPPNIEQVTPMHPLAAEYCYGMLMRAGMMPFDLPPNVCWLIASDVWAKLPSVPGTTAEIYGAKAYEVPAFPSGMIRLVGAAVDGQLNADALR
jgi:hypothetical protein